MMASDTLTRTYATKTIEDLPEEVLEFILGFVPPYKDLEHCLGVCRRWMECVKNVKRKTNLNLYRCIVEGDVVWQSLTPMEMAPTISKRYSHSSVVHDNSMYVFGGCTCTSTTFNDLWRLDLSSRKWIRPLTMGTYPTPKACASMVCHLDSLILFGGWMHPSPYPLHQAWKLNNEVHVYSVTSNTWRSLVPACTLPPMAGHSATVHNNTMVVFGGLQKCFGDYNSQFRSSSDVWCFDLDMQDWSMLPTTLVKPNDRYGQSQLKIDEEHALILGGCGGANMVHSDCWLLRLPKSPTELAVWLNVEMRNPEWAPAHMWCNQACKVGDKVVILGQNQNKSNTVNPSFSAKWNVQNQVRPSSVQLPQDQNRTDNGPQRLQTEQKIRPVDQDSNINGKWGTFTTKRTQKVTDPMPSTSSSRTKKLDETSNMQANRIMDKNIQPIGSNQEQPSTSTGFRSEQSNFTRKHIRPSSPSSEPKRFNDQIYHEPSLHMSAFAGPTISNDPAQSERIRRLEAVTERLRKYEESYQRQQRQKEHVKDPEEKQLSPTLKKIKRNYLGIYVLDISNLLSNTPYVSWMPPNFSIDPHAPEETILYSLVAGKGELIMFGGIKKDANCLNCCLSNSTEQVSHSLHFITAPKEII